MPALKMLMGLEVPGLGGRVGRIVLLLPTWKGAEK